MQPSAGLSMGRFSHVSSSRKTSLACRREQVAFYTLSCVRKGPGNSRMGFEDPFFSSTIPLMAQKRKKLENGGRGSCQVWLAAHLLVTKHRQAPWTHYPSGLLRSTA